MSLGTIRYNIVMNNLAEIEKSALNLSPVEREHLAITVWESLQGNAAFDSEGLELARSRNQDIESGSVKPLSHAEFLLRTGGAAS